MTLLIEIVIQTFLAFFSILFVTRILGRQQLAQLTMFEYINGITFGSIAATLATDTNQKTWQHLIGLLLFGVLTFSMSHLCLKNRKLSNIIQGEPVIVIEEGKILEKNLGRFKYNADDLNHLLRKKDIFDIGVVKYGILETTGELSILKFAKEENVTVSDLKIKPKDKEIAKEVIVTGNIIFENLQRRNLSVKWLLSRLKTMGVKDIRDVFYAYLDKDNNLFIDTMDDHFDSRKDITEEQLITK